MTPKQVIENKLRAEMVQGQMHGCLRDVGRLAGGYASTGALTSSDLGSLGELAESLSSNKQEGQQKWAEAVEYGRDEPVRWEAQKEHRELDWNDTITDDEEYHVIDDKWVEVDTIHEPKDWQPVNELTQYLSALFDTDDHVGYVTEAYYHDEQKKWLPYKGCYDRTAGQLIDKINQCDGDLGRVLGDPNPEVGAYIRFNPLDGAGVKDANVTAYKHALVECDNIDINKQMALIRELDLPVSTVVHSGGKSLHATVKIDAETFEEYRERVNFLYDVCGKNGLSIDRQNRNPSRLSRMPGIMRNGKKQFLVATNMGKPSWKEWKEWIEDINDDLPDISTVEIGDDEPELATSIIDGVLREGHKMLIAGPSKAGKSFALIQLAIAMAEGSEWLGWRVKQGRCLYVNLELDTKSCQHRFWSIYQEIGTTPTQGNIDVWNLRGNATSLDKLTPKLIRRAEKKGYQAVIIDPIYKVLTGDENSAAEMATFCNHFDRICLQLGVATIYCHHHSKGTQGQKSSRDRSSGSGVFARDPDAIIDLIELVIDDERREKIVDAWKLIALTAELDRVRPEWRDELSQDDAVVYRSVCDYAVNTKADVYWKAVRRVRESAEMASGWRIESTLREFATPPFHSVFFRYPVHESDTAGLLKDAKAEGEEAPQEKFKREAAKRNEQAKEKAKSEILDAIESVRTEDGVTLRDVADYLNTDGDDLDDPEIWKTCQTKIRRRIKNTGKFYVKNNMVMAKQNG